MCQLATTDIYQVMKESAFNKQSPFTDEQIEAQFEKLYEAYLDDVFGFESKLEESQWSVAVQARHMDLFDAGKLREKVIG